MSVCDCVSMRGHIFIYTKHCQQMFEDFYVSLHTYTYISVFVFVSCNFIAVVVVVFFLKKKVIICLNIIGKKMQNFYEIYNHYKVFAFSLFSLDQGYYKFFCFGKFFKFLKLVALIYDLKIKILQTVCLK